MKIVVIVILVILASSAFASAKTFGNEYGFVNAWFNGQEAMVKNVKLKIGEPAEIKVTVTSNISGNVHVKLTNPLVTEPYEVIEGTAFEERIDNIGVSPSWSKTFSWKIKPNGAWKNGNAPINFFVQINKDWNDNKKIEFTIANPYILDVQYTGAVTTPKPTAQTTEPLSGASTPPKSTPFIPAIFTIAILLLAAFLWRRRIK